MPENRITRHRAAIRTVLAALRMGMYELLFADGTPDHAAVDQAVELAKGAGAVHASGLVNAVLRRAAREREALVEALLRDDSTPEAAAVAHSAPLWLAQMWWDELGPDGRSCSPPATGRPSRPAASTLATDPSSVIARPATPASGPSCRSGAPYGPVGSKSAPEGVAGRAGDDRSRADRGIVPELIAAGS
jgi:16S rRNA (cytosine967-C5)-methyltransferase